MKENSTTDPYQVGSGRWFVAPSDGQKLTKMFITNSLINLF